MTLTLKHTDEKWQLEWPKLGLSTVKLRHCDVKYLLY